MSGQHLSRVILSLENCLVGREIGEPRLDPTGHRLAVVVSDPIDPTVDAKAQWHVEVCDLVEVNPSWRRISTESVRSVRGLGGGTFDWIPDGSAVVAITAVGDLVESAFYFGENVTKAHDADDRFIFNTTSGDLYFDRDGSGAAAATLIGVLTPGTQLSAADFKIVDTIWGGTAT